MSSVNIPHLEIARLLRCPSIDETILKETLSSFNLQNGLRLLGVLSIQVRKGEREFEEYPQHILSYLARMLLTSDAGYTSRKLLTPLDVANLSHICMEKLPEPLILDANIKPGEVVFQSWAERSWFEQMLRQRIHPYDIARLPLIFENPVLKRAVDAIIPFGFRDYLRLAFIVYTQLLKNCCIATLPFLESDLPSRGFLLDGVSLVGFLKTLSVSPDVFRQYDEEGLWLDSVYAKTKFNPLSRYPIIEIPFEIYGRFLVPNLSEYSNRTLDIDGYYWACRFWYRERFGVDGEYEFTKDFGPAFSDYVGSLLRESFKECRVEKGPKNNSKKEMGDWVVFGKRVYLVEVKSRKYSLVSRQTGDVAKAEANKAAKAIDQTRNALLRLKQDPGMSSLIGKKQVVTIVVFNDHPFPWSKYFRPEVDKFSRTRGVYSLNIRDLELCVDSFDLIDFEEAFDAIDNNYNQDSLVSIVEKQLGRKLSNRFLDKEWERGDLLLPQP